ncbi:MotA/TolQ/ExbB proton channel family protein [Zoogloea sp.]|jgi:biopolymer transport protein ExbB/TolQ|uniref:MotA/TolQ/ExbB proton channel family protein n=1 Tax=Zoogloea sp. TaxID=49181 RepID=UPI0011D5C2BA|nr:MotA/TolQ/ExbB proton channel family protein [Zoogloea sp.]MBK6654920.1 MotA/TolQ/ExbB proton channel family protein [Zoogloea sp.]TXG95440.1 MAG: MotA/TolQ/ExbB proton channel family protein [Zoogloea sp.]
MNQAIEGLMYAASQLFLIPVLLAIGVLFLHAFHALGAFLWQARQRRVGLAAGFELIEARRQDPGLRIVDLEALALARLEFARIATRVAPMLGLAATMIPMGPALKALGDGELGDVSRSLMVAFSAVILALIAAALGYWVVSVRRRWYASDLLTLEKSEMPR